MPFPDGFTTLQDGLEEQAPFLVGVAATEAGERLDPAYLSDFQSGFITYDAFVLAFTVTAAPEESCCAPVPVVEPACLPVAAVVYLGSPCHADDCRAEWDEGRGVWGGGTELWECEPPIVPPEPPPEPVSGNATFWRLVIVEKVGGNDYVSLGACALLGPLDQHLSDDPARGSVSNGDGNPWQAENWESNAAAPFYLTYEFETPTRPTFVTVARSSYVEETPQRLALEYSHDGNDWVWVMDMITGPWDDTPTRQWALPEE